MSTMSLSPLNILHESGEMSVGGSDTVSICIDPVAPVLHISG